MSKKQKPKAPANEDQTGLGLHNLPKSMVTQMHLPDLGSDDNDNPSHSHEDDAWDV